MPQIELREEMDRHMEDTYGRNTPFGDGWISKADIGMARALVKALGQDLATRLVQSVYNFKV